MAENHILFLYFSTCLYMTVPTVTRMAKRIGTDRKASVAKGIESRYKEMLMYKKFLLPFLRPIHTKMVAIIYQIKLGARKIIRRIPQGFNKNKAR